MRIRLSRLVVTFVVAVAAWILVQVYGQAREPHPLEDRMLAAALQTERAFAVVDSVKREGGYAFPGDLPLRWSALLGEDYTPVTTTLGTLAAKEVSTNPAWASVLVGLLARAGVVQGDTVVVLLSASFPALAVATVAAVNELGAAPLIVSSLGASSYGANVRGATWLDWEAWLRDAGVMDIRSVMVTAGGEQDDATGMPDEGMEWLEEAALRNGVRIKRFSSLSEAIEARMGIVNAARPGAIVNVGGGQASLGSCPHAPSLPVGLWERSPVCRCPDRGVLARCAGQGLPVIHLLQVRKLAARYGLDFEPGSRYFNAGDVTTVLKVETIWVVAALSAVLLCIVAPERKQR